MAFDKPNANILDIVEPNDPTGSDVYPIMSKWLNSSSGRMFVTTGSGNWTEVGASITEVSLDNGLGLFGSSPPSSQPGTISDVSGGLVHDEECRTTVNSILSVLRTYGMIDT